MENLIQPQSNRNIEDDSNYEYSDIVYVHTAPVDGGQMNNIRLSFLEVGYSGEVQIDRDRSIIIDENNHIYSFLNFVPLQDNDWQMFIPLQVLSYSTSYFKTHIYARDLQNRVVKGNSGKGENSYHKLTFRCYLGYPQMEVSPSEGKRNYISDFTFHCDNGIKIRDKSEEIYLLKEDKSTVVQTIKGSDLTTPGIDYNTCYYQFKNYIKTEGIYYLYIPEGFFALGNKLIDNKDTWIEYDVTDKQGFYGVTLDPPEGSELESLYTITITFNDQNVVVPYYGNPQKITVTNEAGEVVTYGSASFDENRSQNNICIIKLNKKVITPGEYTLNIPEKAFFFGENADSTSISMYFVYTIIEWAASVSVYTETDENNTLRLIRLSFNNVSIVLLTQDDIEVTLVDESEQVVAKGILALASGKRNLKVDIEPEYQITTPGNYTLIIPSGSIKFGADIYDKELQISVPFNS